jgi:hypothetical protein
LNKCANLPEDLKNLMSKIYKFPRKEPQSKLFKRKSIPGHKKMITFLDNKKKRKNRNKAMIKIR